MKNCPACKASISEAQVECAQCGVIFEKWFKRSPKVDVIPSVAQPISKEKDYGGVGRVLLLLAGIALIHILVVSIAMRSAMPPIVAICISIFSICFYISVVYPGVIARVLNLFIGGNLPLGMRMVIFGLWILVFAVSKMVNRISSDYFIPALIISSALALIFSAGLVRQNENTRKIFVVYSALSAISGLMAIPLLLPFGIVIIPMLASPDLKTRNFMLGALGTVFFQTIFMSWAVFYLTRPKIKELFRHEKGR